MIKTILLIVLAAVAALLLFAATKPDTFRVERSAQIQAPPDRVFALIDDLRAFNTWNPYAKKDPSIQNRYGSVVSGEGAVYEWTSEKVGAGKMTITESASPSRVVMALDFIEPFAAHNTAEFKLEPAGGATQVTWAMYGPAPFMSKLMQVFISMDRMVGDDFASGLTDLKALAEAR